jgi:hypothetical protein
MSSVGKPKEKRRLGRLRIIWEDSIKINLEIQSGLGLD